MSNLLSEAATYRNSLKRALTDKTQDTKRRRAAAQLKRQINIRTHEPPGNEPAARGPSFPVVPGAAAESSLSAALTAKAAN